MRAKSSGARDAPPTRAPSISGWRISSAMLPGLTSLGVPDDDVPDGELGEHDGADLAGERPLVLPVAVLRAEHDRDGVGLSEGLQGPQVGERGADHDVAGRVVGRFESIRELLDD